MIFSVIQTSFNAYYPNTIISNITLHNTFCFARVPVLACKNGRFATQKSLFRLAKSTVLKAEKDAFVRRCAQTSCANRLIRYNEKSLD